MAKEANIKKSLFIFRRDFRLDDNLALSACLNESKIVHAVFILRPEQDRDSLYNRHALRFLLSSVYDLKKHLPNLHFLEGEETQVLNRLKKASEFDCIYTNCDYTPYALKRSNSIREWCEHNKVELKENYHDNLIFNPFTLVTKSNTLYRVFTPFYHNVMTKLPSFFSSFAPVSVRADNILAIKGIEENSLLETFKCYDLTLNLQANRGAAVSNLLSIARLENYSSTHDFFNLDTSGLSPYLKFGLISIRETLSAMIKTFGFAHPVIRQLIWREFWYHFHITVWRDREFGEPYRSEFSAFWPDTDLSAGRFKAWANAATGVPVVDAAINQLNITGMMPNRLRMITASYLVKNLDVHWKWGEHHFARTLTDYDPIVNHWNWQWVAGTGTDTPIYTRIFNPFLQAEKFDPGLVYTKRWLPYDVVRGTSPESVRASAKKAVDKYRSFKNIK